MRGARDLLVKHGLGQYWHNPAACTDMPKDEWKDVVYEAVESSEDAALTARFAQMKGTAAARGCALRAHQALGQVPRRACHHEGRGRAARAQVPERYLDTRVSR